MILSNMPSIFEKNIGQCNDNIKFLGKQNNCTTYFKENEIVIFLFNNEEKRNVRSLKISLENINKNCKIIGKEEVNCKVHYFKGRTQEEWIKDVPVYEKIIYKEIYPSIDLIFYFNKGNLKYDFLVKPYANIDNIKVKINNYDDLNIDDDGNLEIKIKEYTIKILKPITYQNIKGNQINIKSNFIIKDNNVSFQIDEYDKENILVIDPEVLYSTYLGGSTNVSLANSVAVDDLGNAYIVGYSLTSPHIEAYLAKIDTTKSGASSLIYIYYLGGDDDTFGYSVALDKNKNVYITGTTRASNFPIKNGYQTVYQGTCPRNAFLTKIDNSASTILYSTYIGGNAT